MAAQLDHHLRNDSAFASAHGDVDDLIRRGDFKPLKAWLREKIHDHGCFYTSMDELLETQFGEKLNPAYFIEYLQTKYAGIYELETP